MQRNAHDLLYGAKALPLAAYLAVPGLEMLESMACADAAGDTRTCC
jgi:hypothetical protein